MYEEWAGELWGGGTEAARETLVPPSTQPANEVYVTRESAKAGVAWRLRLASQPANGTTI